MNLISKGKIINTSKSLIIAESKLYEESSGKLVATGSGTFMKSSTNLCTVPEYVEYINKNQ